MPLAHRRCRSPATALPNTPQLPLPIKKIRARPSRVSQMFHGRYKIKMVWLRRGAARAKSRRCRESVGCAGGREPAVMATGMSTRPSNMSVPHAPPSFPRLDRRNANPRRRGPTPTSTSRRRVTAYTSQQQAHDTVRSVSVSCAHVCVCDNAKKPNPTDSGCATKAHQHLTTYNRIQYTLKSGMRPRIARSRAHIQTIDSLGGGLSAGVQHTVLRKTAVAT